MANLNGETHTCPICGAGVVAFKGVSSGWRCNAPPCEWSLFAAGGESDQERKPSPTISNQEPWERVHPNRHEIDVKYLEQDIKEAAKKVDPNPSEQQKKKGTYAKGHVVIQGLPIAIETAAGGLRTGKDSKGKPWSIRMTHHYGYVKRTSSEADGDPVDVFIGPDPESTRVFIVDQKKPDGSFDEHKVMLGYKDEFSARQGYQVSYQPNWRGLGAITALSMDQFKQWLKNGDTSKPFSVQKREWLKKAFSPTKDREVDSRYTFYRQIYDRWRNKPDILTDRRIRIEFDKNTPPEQVAIKNDKEYILSGKKEEKSIRLSPFGRKALLLTEPDPVDRARFERAQQADLVTLPKGIKGTNCANCIHLSKGQKDYCKHPALMLHLWDGAKEMTCAHWWAEGTKNPDGSTTEQFSLPVLDSSELERAKHADLITLPTGVKGTNCSNCMYQAKGYCHNPKVDQEVSSAQCCNYWNEHGVNRAWEDGVKAFERPHGYQPPKDGHWDQDTYRSIEGSDFYTGKAMSAISGTSGGPLVGSKPKLRPSPFGKKSVDNEEAPAAPATTPVNQPTQPPTPMASPVGNATTPTQPSVQTPVQKPQQTPNSPEPEDDQEQPLALANNADSAPDAPVVSTSSTIKWDLSIAKMLLDGISSNYTERLYEAAETKPQIRDWLAWYGRTLGYDEKHGDHDDEIKKEELETLYNMVVLSHDNPRLLEEIGPGFDKPKIKRQAHLQQRATLPMLVPVKDTQSFEKLLYNRQDTNKPLGPFKSSMEKRPYPPEPGQFVFFQDKKGGLLQVGRVHEVKPEDGAWAITIDPKGSELSEDQIEAYQSGYDSSTPYNGLNFHSYHEPEGLLGQLYRAGQYDRMNARELSTSVPATKGPGKLKLLRDDVYFAIGGSINAAQGHQAGGIPISDYFPGTTQSQRMGAWVKHRKKLTTNILKEWLARLKKDPSTDVSELDAIINRVAKEEWNKIEEFDKMGGDPLGYKTLYKPRTKSIPPSRFGFPYAQKAGYSGIFVDKLGRKTCYAAGKKVACPENVKQENTKPNQQQFQEPEADPHNDRQHHGEPVKPIVAEPTETFYTLIFNHKGKLLVSSSQDWGGFIWQVPTKEDMADTLYKQTGLHTQKFATVGRPEKGQGYFLLRVHGDTDPGEGMKWSEPEDIQEKLSETDPEWQKRGEEVLQAAVKEWSKKHPREEKKSLEVNIKSVSGPKLTGPIQDSKQRRVCFRDGKHAPCDEFGGNGEGWAEQRTTEDLYDAARRLVNKVKAGDKAGSDELLGMLANTPPEELQKLKRDHRLRVPSNAKEAFTEQVKKKLAALGYTIGEQEQPQQGM